MEFPFNSLYWIRIGLYHFFNVGQTFVNFQFFVLDSEYGYDFDKAAQMLFQFFVLDSYPRLVFLRWRKQTRFQFFVLDSFITNI